MKLVIIGGGFGGLRLARKLSNKAGFNITLIDRFNFHQFQPLFYQVATAGLDASNISFPLRKIFQGSNNIRIILGELKEVVPSENMILTSCGAFSYDVLVLATGADTNFFGNDQLAKAAYRMKSIPEALQIRHSMIQNFEKAVLAKTDAERIKYLTIVIVGGGPTGVELSGAIAEMKKYVLPKDYPELDFSEMKIYLLEGSARTLAVMSEKSSHASRAYLERLGVTVETGTVVQDYDGTRVLLKNGEVILSKMVIWSAGIKGNVPGGIHQDLILRGNRIKVDRYHKVPGMPNVYAIGDVAAMETPKYPHGHPQLASLAAQQGRHLAKHLMHLSGHHKAVQEFEYSDKGTMATIGRNQAVVDLPRPKLHLGGLIAWLIWMSLHLMLILGVKNRLFVFLNWFYNYLTYDQSLRLLFTEFNKEEM